jgi:hypothetical protein
MSKDSQSLRQAKFRQQIRISNSGRPTASERQIISERPKKFHTQNFDLKIRNIEIMPRAGDCFRREAARQSGKAKTG